MHETTRFLSAAGHVAGAWARSADGPTAVEYAVMLALIVIVCLTSIGLIGTNANKNFKDVKRRSSPEADPQLICSTW